MQSLTGCTDLAVDFKPNVTLGTTFDYRSDRHQSDDERLALFDRNVHFLADIGPAQEITRGNDAQVTVFRDKALVLLKDLSRIDEIMSGPALKSYLL